MIGLFVEESNATGFVPHYGADAGRKLSDLLRQHILIAIDVANANWSRQACSTC